MLMSQYYGVSLAYDEGINSDDAILASALWRNMTGMKGMPSETLLLVQYVRSQVAHIDSLSDDV